MKKSLLITLSLMLLAMTPVFAAPAKLLISEVCVTGTGGEFIEIYNPNLISVDLTHYYLADSVDGSPPNYTGITKGTNAVTNTNDFLVKFPDGATIAPGQYLVIAANTITPDTDVAAAATFKLSALGTCTATQMATPGTCFIGSSAAGLITNANEAIMLFYWDGASDLVQDVDYVCWGGLNTQFCDKTGVSINTSTYLADTPIASQKLSATHNVNYSIQRKQTTPIEGAQTSPGNGVTNQDETSEDFTNTSSGSFLVNALRTPGYGMPSDLPPSISGTMFSPGIPTSTDSILVYATVSDDTPGVTAQVKSSAGNYPMYDDGAHGDGAASDGVFGVYIPPQPVGDINFYIEATDTLPQTARDPGTGNYYISVRTTLSIEQIQSARNAATSTMHTVRGIVIAKPGTFSATSTEIYIQDTSGGIKVYAARMRPMNEGDQLTVIGYVTTYNGERELSLNIYAPGYGINKDTTVTLPIPTAKNITTATLNTDSTIQATLIKFTNAEYAPGWSWASTQSGTRTTKIDDGSGITNMWIGSGTGITDPGSIMFDVTGVAAAYGSNTVGAIATPEIHPRRQSDFSANIVVYPGNNMSLHAGDTVAFTASGGTGPYTWTITTTGGTNVGSIVTTGSASAIFTAGPGLGTCYVTATDSGLKFGNSGTITITATSAPILIEPKQMIKPIGIVTE